MDIVVVVVVVVDVAVDARHRYIEHLFSPVK